MYAQTSDRLVSLTAQKRFGHHRFFGRSMFGHSVFGEDDEFMGHSFFGDSRFGDVYFAEIYIVSGIWKRDKKYGHISYLPQSAIINSIKARVGIPLTEEHKKKIGRSGEESGSWKGGISKDINKYMVSRRRTINENRAGRKTSDQCEICGCFGKDSLRGLCYDHDHKTGKFRGWICMRCNTAIGLVKENTETLMAMREYLIKSVNGLA